MSVKRVEVVVRRKRNALPLPLQSCDSVMVAKENPDKKIFFFFFIYIKISTNLSAKYYQKNNERLQKKFVKDIKIFIKKKKDKKRQYGCKQYKNLPENEKKAWKVLKKILWNEKDCLIIIIRNYYFKK